MLSDCGMLDSTVSLALPLPTRNASKLLRHSFLSENTVGCGILYRYTFNKFTNDRHDQLLEQSNRSGKKISTLHLFYGFMHSFYYSLSHKISAVFLSHSCFIVIVLNTDINIELVRSHGHFFLQSSSVSKLLSLPWHPP